MAESEGSPPFKIISIFYLIAGTYWINSPNTNTWGWDIAYWIIVGSAFEDYDDDFANYINCCRCIFLTNYFYYIYFNLY